MDRAAKRRFRRKSVGGGGNFDPPSVNIASCLTIALQRATQRAERAEAEVLALLGDKAKPSAKEEVECAICCEKLATDKRKRVDYNNEVVQLLQCRHIFHHRCIENYLRSRQNLTAPCPVCRTLDAACYTVIKGIRGQRLPLSSSSSRQEDVEWLMCLGEARSRPLVQAGITLILSQFFQEPMTTPLPTALELTNQILKGVADDEDI